ncbi:hypothetical protein [Niabella sp.]|uniref:adenylate/guanylate cyclase domain-containing protein n=1 Tax=Niabella sp. TaxID=1962976 RepID=UPI0026266C31|nr:hypothetical protein [Niabella sp.]
MQPFSDYLTTIEAALHADPLNQNYQNLHTLQEGKLSKGLSFEAFNRQIPEMQLQPSLQRFANELGKQPNFNQQLGLHPDFSHLKHSNSVEHHYIVSMFVDIKGSTNLFKRYKPLTVLIVTNAIQRAAIHTCLLFGGYIHRLQGDGLFVYFGGRNIPISKAVADALQFASVFTYFVKNDLKNLFNEQGIETIFTRIGIDLGYDEDVIWALAGVGEISEITTCSLHTSLASKMQGYAPSNGVVAGDHILDESYLAKDLFVPVCHRTKYEADRYIFQIPEKRFNYTQYDFNWMAYLKRQSYIVSDLSGHLHFKDQSALKQQSTAMLAPIAAASKPYYHG